MKSRSEIGKLISTLSIPPSERGAGWIDTCVMALAHVSEPTSAILTFLDSMSYNHRQSLFDGSHETSTHYKWLIYRNADPRFTLWLHEYKDPIMRNQIGYADVPHNHRYDIVSLIIRGGYTAATWESSGETLTPLRQQVFAPGRIMHLQYHEIHNLVAIEPDTLTLVVEGQRLAGHSLAYYPTESAPRIFRDFPERWPDLKARLLP